MIKDTLLITCPGEDGGLFVVSKEVCTRLSFRATTGLFVDDNKLIFAYQGDGGNSIRVFSNNKTEEVLLAEERLDLHDVLVAAGKLYVVATETNSVVCLDESFRRVASWNLPGENDSVHMNSVAFYKGRLLASIFGRFVGHLEYKQGTTGLGEVIDIQTTETFISGLSQPHSLTVQDDLLYLCCSEERQLRGYRDKELVQQVPLPGYARGIAFSGDNLYVGISASRNAKYTENSPESASIVVFDSGTMQQKHVCSLPCREIYDIRVVEDIVAIYPHLPVDLMSHISMLNERMALYKRGHESYEKAYNEITSSYIWRWCKPLWHIEKRFKRWQGK